MTSAFSILFYCLYLSAVLLYGIGLKQSILMSRSLSLLLITGVQTTVSVLISIIPSWFICIYLLIPAGLAELYPLTSILILMPTASLIHLLCSRLCKTPTPGISISIPCLLLALNESNSLAGAIIMAACFCVSFFLFIPLVYAIRKRLKYAKSISSITTGSLLFFSIAVILCALYAWNISWFQIKG